MSESDLFNMPYFSQIFLMAALHKKQETADLVTFTGEILDGVPVWTFCALGLLKETILSSTLCSLLNTQLYSRTHLCCCFYV